MKKTMTYFALLTVVMFSYYCAEAPDAETAGTGEAQTESEASGHAHPVDVEASEIGWIGTKLTGQHNGTIRLKSGSIQMESDGKITGGEFVMDMSTITVLDLTGENKEKLEKHLRDTDFFEVAKFPTAKFVITSAEPAGDGKLKVTGNLTMRDVTKSVTFTANVESKNNMPAKITADFNIDRQLWGIVYKGKPDDAIRDEVNIKPVLVLK